MFALTFENETRVCVNVAFLWYFGNFGRFFGLYNTFFELFKRILGGGRFLGSVLGISEEFRVWRFA